MPATMTSTADAKLRATGHGGSLTAEQVAEYDREGFLVVDHLLDDEDLAPCREAMNYRVNLIAEDLYERGAIKDKLEHEPFKYRLARLFDGLSEQDYLKYSRSWRERHPGYYRLMSNPKVLDAVESLIGGEIFSNPVYNTRPKVANVGGGAVPWHQDKSYWPDANSNPVITVWIPLVDANAENGCLQVWPRTHRTRMFSFHRETLPTSPGFLEIDAEHLKRLKREAVALPMSTGSAILFNDRCVHMSTPNKSDHVRWSVDLRYQPTNQDPMPRHGAGFLARSYEHPEREATLEDWLAQRPEHE